MEKGQLVITIHLVYLSSPLSLQFRHTAVLDTPAIIGIAAGGAGAALLLTVVCLLMLCVYRCAKRGSHESECLCAGREGGRGGGGRLPSVV